MCKIVFNKKINYKYDCDNYIYNCKEVRQLLKFKAYNMTAKLNIININIAKYFNLLLFNEQKRLFAKIFVRNPKTIANQCYSYIKTLNNFV